MLFNSYIFIFAFLPLTIVAYRGFWWLGGRKAAFSWLVAASLFFYAWWNPPYVALVLASILFNYFGGILLRLTRSKSGKPSFALLSVWVAVNLLLLGYYKYANFFVDTINYAANIHLNVGHVFLPLAISFFTFTQISYLVDTYHGAPSEYDLLDYCLFVVFFPHLIAGPIVRHHEILPQIWKSDGYLDTTRLPAALTLFAFGLFSKTVLADSIAPYSTTYFDSVYQGLMPSFFSAWIGTLAFTCQIYFDFAGYSTMALGLAYIFDIKMPFNFDSPYKARSIVEFWRRWHMSLSRFLRDYLYIPLGGNRRGKMRRYINLMITMLLGGLWHGAGWTFVIWGGLHGLYLCVNHAWTTLTRGRAWANTWPMRGFYYLITFLAVCAAWVVFKAQNLMVMRRTLEALVGLHGISFPIFFERFSILGRLGVRFENIAISESAVLWIAALLAIAFFMPNVQQVMHKSQPSFEPVKRPSRIAWQPSPGWALVAGTALVCAVIAMSSGVSEFIYFQF